MEVKRRLREAPVSGLSLAASGMEIVGKNFPETFPDLVRFAADSFGDKIFLPRRSSRGGDPISFAELSQDVRRVSAGLCSYGIQHGDRVALISENRYEWLVSDLATVSIGAIDVPRGVDTAPKELRFILEHSGSRFAFVEGDRVAADMITYTETLPDFTVVCTLEAETAIPGVITLAELMARGDKWLTQQPDRLDAMSAGVTPEDVLTIVYTSGTTAEPKGVMLTHRNVLSNVRICGGILDFTSEDRLLSLLPAWHAYERMLDYVAFSHGAEMTYTDRRHFKKDMCAVEPTAVAAVPRVWEMLHDGIIAQIRKTKGIKRKMLDSLMRTSVVVGGNRANMLDRLLHGAIGRKILPKLKGAIGVTNLRIAVSGGGSLPAHIDERLLGMGIPLLNGYGLTETSPVASVRLPGDNRAGTIGPPLPGTTIEARTESGQSLPKGQTGILWIHGPQVMKGYFKNAQKTAEALDENKWFNSGDLGHIAPDGHVCITGRAKDTIVLAGGENVEPEPVEAAIKTSPQIEQAVVIGQDRKQLGALIVIDPECVGDELAKDLWEPDEGTLNSQELRTLVRQELDRMLSRANGFRAVEKVGPFIILAEPMTPESGLLTQTLKIKRHLVNERYGDLIEEMYR